MPIDLDIYNQTKVKAIFEAKERELEAAYERIAKMKRAVRGMQESNHIVQDIQKILEM